MDKLILFNNTNNGGNLAIIKCDESKVDGVLARAIPKGAINVRVMDAVDLDRNFRNAWRDEGAMVTVDMIKARAIHLDRLRDLRVPVLARLDVAWSMAAAKKDSMSADQIEAKRQALRDMPQTIQTQLDAATTPDALMAIEPLILKG